MLPRLRPSLLFFSIITISYAAVGCGENAANWQKKPVPSQTTATLKYDQQEPADHQGQPESQTEIRVATQAESDGARTPSPENPQESDRIEQGEASALKVKLVATDFDWRDDCDVHTEMTLFFEEGVFKAKLENKLGPTSTCYIYVRPEVRTYQLTTGEHRCSSVTYFATADDGSTITIKDHSTRECTDLKPAKFEVTEDRLSPSSELSYISIDGVLWPNPPTNMP